MRNKHIIKVDWQQPEPVNIEAPDAEECLELAAKSEQLNQPEWAEYWLDQATRREGVKA